MNFEVESRFRKSQQTEGTYLVLMHVVLSLKGNKERINCTWSV